MDDTTTRRQRITVAVLAVLVGLTRFLPLSRGPWDWDEILFSIAVSDYNVAAHQPHPAGFPLFVLLAKIARFFSDSDFHAVQAVNVVASLFVFPVMYAAARAFRLDFAGSIGAALIFSFLTNVWFYGGTAFSDPSGMVLFLAAIAAYLSAGLDARRYVLASLLLAAAVLVRPQNALVAVFPWTIATVRLLRARRFRAVAAGSLVILLLAGIGYGIAAYDSGVEKYVNSIRSHSQYVTAADSVVNEVRPSMGEVLLTYLDPFYAGKVAWLMNILALIAIVAGRRHVVAEVLLTFVPFMVFSMLAANPAGSSRFSLNYLAGLVILAVEGTDVLARLASRLAERRRPAPADAAASRAAAGEGWGNPTPVARAQDSPARHQWQRGTLRLRSVQALPHQPARDAGAPLRLFVLAAVVTVIVGRLITWGLPAFELPRKDFAPPAAAALWIRDHVPENETVFVHGGIQPWVRYLAPRHTRIVVGSTREVLAHPAAVHGWYVESGQPPAEGVVAFVWPRNRTWNIVTRRGFEAFVQPTDEILDFADGWHGVETDGTSTWRWTARRAVLRFGPSSKERELRLQFYVPVHEYKHPVTVTVSVNGHPVQTTIARAENDLRCAIRGRPDRVNEIAIELSDAIVPARSGGSDHRELGLMLRSWSWSRR